ncbi:glycosyltransferase family 4 protein [Muribaculum intestinale]|uniref:glycosyltransferase family 4 protein n=1 Tax=Muribaculum intestinale TaxID=1796646 RepID=UPI0025A96988|nr:glycosyltransferase family 4 protein [Muribaculum intestinale]
MSKRAKVLVIATSRKTRGGITAVIKAHEQGQQWKDFECYWIQTHRDGCPFKKMAYLSTAIINYVIRISHYDIVHIHFSNGNSLIRKLIFARIAHHRQKKILIHFHAYNPNKTIHGENKKAYRELFEMADKIIVLSNWWKEEVTKAFPNVADRVCVLYNPCENIDLKKSIKAQNKILYAGTVNQRKGYADLIRAFAKIASKYPEWSLSIAGNGEIEEGKQLATSLGISSQVEFLGWVKDEAKQCAFQEASIFCLPSYAEGFPMAVLDAWAYGLPVITTPVGGIPDIAKDGDNMLLFNPGDINTLATKLDTLISDQTLRKHIADESIKLAHGPFSINSINSQLADIYHSL